jgi:ribonuclease HI
LFGLSAAKKVSVLSPRDGSAIQIFSDGSAGNRKDLPGAWAFAIVLNDVLVGEGKGGCLKTTCLIMEIEAARAGLLSALQRQLHQNHRLELVTDSSIVLEIAAGTFIPKPERYHEHAQSLRAAAQRAHVSLRWVRAHHGSRWNEYVDAQASAYKKQIAVRGEPAPQKPHKKQARIES